MNILDNRDLKELCTGCSACLNICPANAITMQEDDEGFLQPVIDMSKCTNCGLCKKQCPITNSKFNDKPEICYAVAANDDIRKMSSSGGIFTVVAEYIIKQGGCVCGAAFDKDWKVKHILVDKIEDLWKLRGSKYVQSEIGYIYNEIKELLEQNKPVFFTGTPCQVAGLYSVLGKDFQNLFTADLVCHGVPNNKIWQKYIDDNFDRYNIAKINFRDKEQNGWSCTTTITTKNGQVFNIQSYFDGFSHNLYLRKSCYNCSFAKLNRVADFTLGDFWGIEQLEPKLNDSKGTSLLLCNTTKTRELFKTLKEKFRFFEEFSSKFLETGPNYPLYRSSIVHKNRPYFFANIYQKKFNKLITTSLNKQFDVGILGLWYVGNYGGFLTYWALYKFLEKHNYNPILIDNSNMLNHQSLKIGHNMMIINYINRYNLNSTRPINCEYELYKLNENIDNFIVGSDQIWNYWLTSNRYTNYLLDFVKSNKNKIACASSYGGNKSNVPNNLKEEVKYYLEKFDAISVRENKATDILKKEFDIDNAIQILDPVFYAPECYEELIDNVTIEKTEPYIFVYCLDPTDDKENMIAYAAQKLGLTVKLTTDLNPYQLQERKNKFKKFKALDASIEEWLYYIKNSDFVIADSFHAICFAIIYKKNFICIANRDRGIERFISILSKFNLLDKIVYSFEDMINNKTLFNPINYNTIDTKIEEEKNKNIHWLLNCINKKKSNKLNDFDLMIKSKYQLEEQIIGTFLGLKNEINNEINKINENITYLKNKNYFYIKYYAYKWLNFFLFGKLRHKQEKYKKIIRKIREL